MFSEEAMLASRDFMTSVVVGKDAVPRIGMHQAETLRLFVMIELFQHKGLQMVLFDQPPPPPPIWGLNLQ